MALNLGSPWISHPIPILFNTSSISSSSRSSLFLLLLTRYRSGIYALKHLSLSPSPSSSHPNNFHTRPRASSRAREDENPENSSSELLNDDLLRRVLGAKDADEALETIAENCGRNGGVVRTVDCCSIIGAALDRNNTDLAFSVFSAMRSSFDDGGVGENRSSVERWKWARPDARTYAVLIRGLAASLKVSDAIRMISCISRMGVSPGEEVPFGKIVRCPSCMMAIAVAQPQHGTQVASCSKCRYQYELFSGDIVSIESEEISMGISAWEKGLRFLQIMKQSIPAAVHSVVVRTPAGTARTHRFATKTVELPAQEGERVTIALAAPSNVYREVGPFKLSAKAPGYSPGEAMSLTNHISGQESQLLRAPVNNGNSSLLNPSFLFPALVVLATGDTASGIIDPSLPRFISIAAVASVALGTTINSVILPQLSQLPQRMVDVVALKQQLLSQYDLLQNRIKDLSQAAEKEEVESTGASECLLDFTNVFTTDMIFRSREGLIQWTRDVGKKHGLVIVIKTSDAGGDGRKPRVLLSCERSGSYRSPSKVFEKRNPKKATGTKKCSCPFALKGRKLATDDDWMLTVVCGVHNHPNAQHLEGHSFAGRLSMEEINVLIDMFKSLVKPRNILRTLQERDVHNTTTIKSIYNARQKFRVTEMAGRSQIQQLMRHLEENNYIEYHTSNDATDELMNLFWAHPSSIQLLRAFPEVLIMDSTYKTNRYRLPLLEIVGVTSTQLTFSVAFVYLESEREANYRWALERLKELMDGCITTRVIVTDKELALMNAINVIFPNAANLLCRWHISRNILANCKKCFETNDRWVAFISCWNTLVVSPTEIDYTQMLSALERNYCGYPHAVDYVKTSWLNKHKEQFVAAWTDRHMHFGNVTTNRAESAHAKLKRHLGTSSCSFDSSWQVIHALLELLFTEIKASFEKSLNTVQHKFKPALFRQLRGFLSRSALDIVLNESLRASDIGPDSTSCGCVIRRTHGLPCAHEIAEYIREGSHIPLCSVHHYWRKLNLEATMVNEALQLTTTSEFELISKRFQSSDEKGKIQILRKLRELGCPSSSSLIEPGVKLNTRGRSSSKRKKLDTSTRREPSNFEYALSIKDSVPARLNNTVATKNKEKMTVRRTRSCTFMHLLPQSLGPYIHTIKDVAADGNCGFRAIAGLLGLGEDKWMQVRMDLSNELQRYQNYYAQVYGGEDRVGELYYALCYFESNPSFDRWMTMPDMGHLISSYYNVVLVLLSLQQCLTFLPLRSSPIPSTSHKVLAVGFVNGNHFVQVFMKPESPMPPIATNWHRHHHPEADGWQLPYTKSIKQFRELIGNSLATQESVNLDSD